MSVLRVLSTVPLRGKNLRAWLGIAGKTIALPPRVAERVGSPTGMQVASVVDGSPAERAGIHSGDIMVELDGTTVVTATAVQKLMVEDAIDRRIEITVWRNGALVDVVLQPRELELRS